MKKENTKKKEFEEEREIKNKTKLKKPTILALIPIIGFAIALVILGEGAITNQISGKVIGVEEENLYSMIFIVFILLIASIAALVYLRKK